MKLFYSVLLAAAFVESPFAEARIGIFDSRQTKEKNPQLFTIVYPEKSHPAAMLVAEDTTPPILDYFFGDSESESHMEEIVKEIAPLMSRPNQNPQNRKLQDGICTDKGPFNNETSTCLFDEGCACESPKVLVDFGDAYPGNEGCYACAKPDGAECSFSSECLFNSDCADCLNVPGSASCVEKVCAAEESIVDACNDQTTSSSRSCTLNADCQCLGSETHTQKYSFVLSSGSNQGQSCYACNIPDGNACDTDSDVLQCISGSECYEGTCTPTDEIPIYCPSTTSSNGARQCTSTSECLCPNQDEPDKTFKLELDLPNDGGKCYACTLPPGASAECDADTDCPSGEVCNNEECIDPQDIPVECPQASCSFKSTCFCTPPYVQELVLCDNTDGYRCALPLGEACEEDGDCIAAQCYSGICTAPDDVPRSCPTSNTETSRSCSEDALCSCDDTDPKTERVELESPDGVCYACALPDGATCATNTDCMPDSDCYNDVCTPENDIPVYCDTRTEGNQRYCGYDSSCECESADYEKLTLSAGSNSCYACAKKDTQSCETTIECAPGSICYDQVCTDDNTVPVGATGDGSGPPCPKLEDQQCATDINCGCSSYGGNYEQKYLQATSGVPCWACYEPIPDYDACTSSLFCENYSYVVQESTCTCVQGDWDTSLDAAGQQASFECVSYQCSPTGGIPNGKSCIRNTMCASGYCDWPPEVNGVRDTTLKKCAPAPTS
jgi:hypothetical protein